MAEKNNYYPMISENTWWTIREKFQATVPSVITTTYVKTLLTLASDDSAISNVISPLRRIGLIDAENKPTSLAYDWRLDDKYEETCATIIKNVYPTELLELFPNRDIDKVQARNWFMSQGVGQAAANKMIALFSLLKSGEIKAKKGSTPKKQNKQTQNRTKAIQSTPSTGDNNSSIDCNASNPVNDFKRPNIHIDLQIHISPDSTPEQIECIFASMAKHLYGVGDK